jgi:hypothetical protein
VPFQELDEQFFQGRSPSSFGPQFGHQGEEEVLCQEVGLLVLHGIPFIIQQLISFTAIHMLH